MSQITIVTSPGCPYCHAAKSLLQKQGMAYQEVDLLKNNEEGQQLMIQSGRRTVPQIFINDQAIGGYTELSQLLKNQEYDASLSPIV